MSTEISMFAGGNLPALPAHLQGHVSAVTASLKSHSEGNRISIRGRAWRLVQDGAEVAVSGNPEMDLAILAALPDISRTYFAKEYTEGDTASPDCWSSNGTVPDAGVTTPCATSCAACPMNVPGSGKRDQSRACRHSKRIAVAIPSELALATPDRPARAYLMQIPATSVFGDKVADDQPKSLTQYGNFLASRNMDAGLLVTRFSFDLASTQPTLRFSAQRFLSEPEFAGAMALVRDPATMAMLPFNYAGAKPTAPMVSNHAIQVTQQAPVAEAGFGAPIQQAVAPTPVPVPVPVPVQQAQVDVGFGAAPEVVVPVDPAPVQPRTTAPANAEPVVVSTAQAAASAGVAAGNVADLLSKWGA